MRCLQCGKGIPLFKRLGGSSEFCSEAHRREYQREYSQLALGRLLQSHPIESRAEAVKAPPLANATAPAVDEALAAPAVNGTRPAARPGTTPAWAEKAHPATTPSAPAAKPSGIAKPQPPAVTPEKNAASQPAASERAASERAPSQPPASQSAASVPAASEKAPSQPATAKLAVVQKPAPAKLQFALAAAPEFEHAFASLAPDRPRREPDMLQAELPHGGAVAWESPVDVADSVAHPRERKLDLRDVSRPAPRIALDLRIVPAESFETENRPLTIPFGPAAPAEASLWSAPPCNFAGQLAPLSDFADAQFSKSGFEAPELGGSSATSVIPESSFAEPQLTAPEIEPTPEETPASSGESQTAAAPPAVPVPDPELDPLPVSCTGIAPGKAKPIAVFGPAPISASTVQIPQPNGLPLRPVMVLAPAAAPTIEVKHRKGGFLSLRSALSIKTSLQQSRTSTSLSSELNLGLFAPPMQTPVRNGRPWISTILTAVTGAAVLGAGLFFFLGKQSDAGLKSPAPALSDGALGGQWIANFAPDVQHERRVSLLRSSMKLAAYRLDFESSIRIKALGWVYRAQDSKNFYVSKIEFQKPGLNPVYALVHYAIINGVEQPRVETPLHVAVPMGGLYKIRFEAVGNHFTTWVQGQRVEQWTDPRLSSGGAGLYSEGVEQSALHGDFVVTPLSN